MEGPTSKDRWALPSKADIADAAAWDLTGKTADRCGIGPEDLTPTLMTFSQREWLDGRTDMANVCMSTTKPDAQK